MSDDNTVHFYFDFLSPFGYFGSLRVDDVAHRYGYACEWHPILLGVSVLKVMGLPPVGETPLKGPYIRHDMRRYARRHGIELGRAPESPQINPLLPTRAFCWLKQHQPDIAKASARALYAAHWRDDVDISGSRAMIAAVSGVGADTDQLSAGIASGEAATLLRQEVDSAIDLGVFGSPTFRVGAELFWGVEKMEVLEDWLRTGGW